MKMRQFKRAKMAMMSYALFGPWGPIGQWLGLGSSRFVQDLPVMTMPVIDNVQEAIAQAERITVKRVKDDVVVDSFDTREEALALINKHFKQKKAKLYAMQGGEPVMFNITEFA